MQLPGEPVTIDTFQALDIRAGIVVRALPFPEARKPSIRLWVDFGPGVGVLQSSAGLTRRYTPEGLEGLSVLAIVNLPPRRVAGFRSECLVLGVTDPDDAGDVVLVQPGAEVPPGWRLC